MKTLATFFILVCTLPLHAAIQFQTQCSEISAPVPLKYCVQKAMGVPTSDDFVYYLHGRGGSEKGWSEDQYYPAQIRSEWERRKVRIPTVISVSFGPIWILAHQNSSEVSGLLELFTLKMIPQIEASLGGLKGRRLVIGDSMGGFNTAQLALRTSLFQKAAVICAPMAELSPFASPSEIQSFIEKSHAWAYYKNADPDRVKNSVQDMITISNVFYPNPTEWEKADPLQLALSASPKKAAEIYLAAGFYDQFALYEGNEVFAARLEKRGFKVDWRPQWGGHCAIDIPTVAAFLTSEEAR